MHRHVGYLSHTECCGREPLHLLHVPFVSQFVAAYINQ